MSEIRLQVAFDYVDPGSYLVHEVLSRWNRDRGDAILVSWISLELRPPPVAGIDPTDSQWLAMTAAMEDEALVAGIPFRRPERVPRSRKAHELSLHAREKGLFNEVHRAIFDAHFVSGEDIGRVDVLTRLAEEVGLEGAEVRTVLGVDRFLAEVEQARGLARGMGVRGVPTIELPGLRIEGFEGERPLRDVLDRIAGIQD